MFGSVARGAAGPESDLDLLLLVEFEREWTLLNLAALQIVLESPPDCRVDVVTERGLRQGIRDDLVREAIPL